MIIDDNAMIEAIATRLTAAANDGDQRAYLYHAAERMLLQRRSLWLAPEIGETWREGMPVPGRHRTNFEKHDTVWGDLLGRSAVLILYAEPKHVAPKRVQMWWPGRDEPEPTEAWRGLATVHKIVVAWLSWAEQCRGGER